MSGIDLPKGYRRVVLSDVATRTSRRCTPEISRDVRWIGADHLDEGDLRVRRWSTTDDPLFPPTFYFKVPEGSVLLHSRNPKKVALLEFEVITGEKLFCLTANDHAELSNEFLALQLQSDHFMTFVAQRLSGSVNKFLNWSALARYEFALPPEREQREIVEVLLATDRVRETASAASEEWRLLAAALVAEVLDTDVPERDLAGCCRLPISYGIVQPGTPVVGGIPFVNVEDMTAGPLDRDRLPTTTEEISGKHQRTVLDAGDVLVALRGPIGLTAIASEDIAGANLSRGVARLAPKDDVHSGYIAACLSTPFVSRQIERTATGSTFKELKIGALRSLRVPVPDMAVQKEIAAKIEAARLVGLSAASSADQARVLKRQLMTALTETTHDV